MRRGAFAAMAMTVLALPAPLAAAGAAWTATRAPLPAGAAATSPLSSPLTGVSDVSCRSAATCAAAGHYTDSAGNAQVLLLTGHGLAWTASRAPLPAGAAQGRGTASPGPTVASVACRYGSACVAVGGYTDAAGHLQGLLLSGYGSSWTAARAPLPPGAARNPGAVLSRVACPSATECVAAGYYTDSAGHEQGLLLTGRGSSWTATRAPLPPGASASGAGAAGAGAAGTSGEAGLWDVSCPSAAVCVAAGFYGRHGLLLTGLLLTGHGSEWTATRAPLPASAEAGSQADLYRVTCPSAGSCVAAGDYDITSHTDDGLLLAGHGSSWAAIPVPLPAGAGPSAGRSAGRSAGPSADPDITGVSCGSAAACVAVGYYTDLAGHQQGLLVAGHGSSWTARRAPRPPGARPGAFLTGVSCPAPAACVAVGYYTDPAGHEQGLLLTEHGGSWTARPAPLPAGAAADPAAYLNGVTCASITACLAAGAYTDSSGHGQGLLLPGPG